MKIVSIPAIVISVFWAFLSLNFSQTSLFKENFESKPINSISMYQQVESGKPWEYASSLPDTLSCGHAARGNALSLNSSNVDFNLSQNSGYFLGINPESPCQGHYTVALNLNANNLLDSYDSVIIQLNFYKTSTLKWAGDDPIDIQLSLENDSRTYTYNTETNFKTRDTWSNFKAFIPDSMLGENLKVKFDFNAGEGIGIDDIEIFGYSTPVPIKNSTSINFIKNKIYIRSQDKNIIQLHGVPIEKVRSLNLLDTQGRILDINWTRQKKYLELKSKSTHKGIYFIRLNMQARGPQILKLIIP